MFKPSGEEYVELVEGCFPVVGSCHAHAAASFLFHISDGEVSQLQQRVVACEMAPVLGDLAQLVGDGLDGVGGIDLGREGQEKDDLFPGMRGMPG